MKNKTPAEIEREDYDAYIAGPEKYNSAYIKRQIKEQEAGRQ